MNEENGAGFTQQSHGDEDSREGGPKFEPRLFIQRYLFVEETLKRYGITSVVDFGAAECRMLRYLRGVSTLRHIALVDIDRGVLMSHKRRIAPLITDYIFTTRCHPLRVDLFVGDISEFDERLQTFECVTMVELIEHLPEGTLKAFPSVVFGDLRPRLVIITTPNSEFNVLFPGLSGFRHWDHKFEWTRNEFQLWCNEVASRYGYCVQFTGVGEPPPESWHLGHCSQAAVFELASQWTPSEDKATRQTNSPYNLISSCIHPCRPKPLADIDQLRLDVAYYVNFLSPPQDADSDGYVSVPVETLLSFLSLSASSVSKPDLPEFRIFLQEEGYNLTDDKSNVVVATFVSKNDLDDTSSSDLDSTDESVSNDQPPECWDNVDDVAENWDDG